MRLVIGRIKHLDRLSIFYRSTSPGHPACEKSADPYSNGIVARDAEKDITPRLKAQVEGEVKQQRARWDWDLFEVHNELWRKAIDRLMRDRAQRKSRTNMALGAKWYYLDLWSLNLQRPDAHSEPGIDCLHCELLLQNIRKICTFICYPGCLPSVLNDWTLHLYHNLFLKSISREDD